MRLILATLLAWASLSPLCLSAQSKPEDAVLSRVEALRLAMVDADGKRLDELTSDKLSYGHSNLRIEDKKSFMDKLVSGDNDFITMELTEKQVTLSGRTAIVRCRLEGQTMDGGKPGQARLHVLMVWQREGRTWKLLARQAVKLP
jgi:hypothetical protein